LAKRYETIVQAIADYPEATNSENVRLEGEFRMINFPADSPTLHLLQRIRDEAHRFAVSYHTVIRKKRTHASLLEEIPGIGPATRKKLIRHFGSARAVASATQTELAKIAGSKTAKILFEHTQATSQNPTSEK